MFETSIENNKQVLPIEVNCWGRGMAKITQNCMKKANSASFGRRSRGKHGGKRKGKGGTRQYFG